MQAGNADDHAVDLDAEIGRWLSPQGEKHALELSSPGCSLVLRRARGNAGRVGCWSQLSIRETGRAEALRGAGFHEASAGQWLLELDNPSAASISELWARIGGERANTRAAWLDDHVSARQIVAIVLTLVAWIGVTLGAVFGRVWLVYDVFEWFGGFHRPKTAGGAALVTVALVILVPLFVLSQIARVLRKKRPAS